jgi:hypothetical protein
MNRKEEQEQQREKEEKLITENDNFMQYLKNFFENINTKEKIISREYLVCTFSYFFVLKKIKLLSYPNNTEILREELEDILREYYQFVQKASNKINESIKEKTFSKIKTLLSFVKKFENNNNLKIKEYNNIAEELVISAIDENNLIKIETNLGLSKVSVNIIKDNVSDKEFMYAVSDSYYLLVEKLQEVTKKVLDIMSDNTLTELAIKNLLITQNSSNINLSAYQYNIR